MAIEQFSPPKKIGKLVQFLRSQDGLEQIQHSSEFVSLEKSSDGSNPLGNVQLCSTLLGNPAVRLNGGILRTTYEPQDLIDVVQSLMTFRDDSRSILNAINHGYRLPKFTDHSIEAVIRQKSLDASGADVRPEQVRQAIRSSALVPSFWFLESDPENRKRNEFFEGATAELRLYGVSPNVGQAYCRLVLELLKLLFDSTRNTSRFGEIRSRIREVDFKQVMQPLLRMQFPIQRPPDGEPYIVSAYVPQE